MDQKMIMMTQKISADEREMRMTFLSEQQRRKEKGESICEYGELFAEILLELQCQNLLLRKLLQNTNQLSLQVSDWRYSKEHKSGFNDTAWEWLVKLLLVISLVFTIAVCWKVIA